MAETIVFPQSGDNDDAEHFAAMLGQENLVDHVESGGTFTVDYGVPEVTISDITTFIGLGNQTASSSGDTVRETGEVVQVTSATKALTDSDVNHIYVEPDNSTDDNATFQVYTSTSSAASNALKIGEIDTTNNTATEFNRAPSASFAASVSIEDSSDSSTKLVELTGTGPLDLANVDLDLSDNNIDDVASIDGGGDAVVFDDDINLKGSIDLEGTGSNSTVTLDDTFDLVFEDDSGADILQIVESGRVDVAGGNLRIEASNAIEDASGNEHLTVNDSGNLDVERTLNFPNITGTPTFANHDHSEGGMTTIPNSGLTNSSVTLTAGVGIDSGGGSLSLGGSTTLAVGFDDDEDLDFGTGDDYVVRYDGTGTQLEVESNDIDGGGTTGVVLRIPDGQRDVDFLSDISFPNITGTPTFSGHDHSESGMTTIPNSGLTNSSITITSGDGLTGGGSTALGSSTTLDVRLDIEDSGSDVTTAFGINFGDNLSVTDDSDNTVTVDGSGGVEIQDDGASVVSAATLIDFGGSDFDVSNPTAGEAEVVISSDAIGTSEIDLSITPTWTGRHSFSGALDTPDDTKFFLGTGDDFSFRYASTPDVLRLRDDSGSNDIAEVDKSGNLNIEGTLTESTTV